MSGEIFGRNHGKLVKYDNSEKGRMAEIPNPKSERIRVILSLKTTYKKTHKTHTATH